MYGPFVDLTEHNDQTVFNQAFNTSALVPGAWYQVFVPGGFTMFGRLVRALPYGRFRFAQVHHLKNANNWELPRMTHDAWLPEEVEITTHPWWYLDTTFLAMSMMDLDTVADWQDSEVNTLPSRNNQDMYRLAWQMPEHVPGAWYQLAVPGGFTLFGRLVKPLANGTLLLAQVHHLRNSQNMELAQMSYTSAIPPEPAQVSEHYWKSLITTSLWYTVRDPKQTLAAL